MADRILNKEKLFRRVMGANPPSSPDNNRCYSKGHLSFLTQDYRCFGNTDQLVSRIFPRMTLKYSYDSPEDAAVSEDYYDILWEDGDWNMGNPMMISDNGHCYFYFDEDSSVLIRADDGYYMKEDGTYYHIENGIVTEMGQYGGDFYIEPASGDIVAAGGQANAIQFTVHTNHGSFSVSTTFGWLHTSVNTTTGVVTVWADENTRQIALTGTISVTSGGQSKSFVVRQAAATASNVLIDLQNMWMRDSAYDVGGLIAFKSQAHKGVNSSYDVAKIKVSGTSSIDIYIRSNHGGPEANYDYAILSTVNATSYPQRYTDTTAKQNANTWGAANGGTSLSDYVLVQYTGLSTSSDNYIYVVYRKDSSDSVSATGTDEAYVLLPSETAYINSYQPTI